MTDAIREQYSKARADQINRNEARRIRTKVMEARGSRHDAGVRWPFELLQNALDAGPREGRETVSLSLSASNNSVVFEHDGAPFSLQELAALLSGGSSKDFEAEDKTGRFGTGFLVTHVLAESTNLVGVVAGDSGYEKFRLLLERGGDEEAILDNIHQCERDLEAAVSVDDFDAEPSATFEYEVEDDKTLGLGFDAFITSLPYLYSTRATLGVVHVVLRDGSSQVWDASEREARDCESGLAFDRTIVVKDQGGNTIETYRSIRFQKERDSRSSSIVLLSKCENGWRVRPPAKTFPRIFRDYPIRGSHFLPLNFVINGKFDVSQERDRVLMKEGDKALLSEALGASLIALKLATSEHWQDYHRLVDLSPVLSSFGDNEDELTWWNDSLVAIANAFAALPIIETRKGKGAALANGAEWFVDFPLPRLLAVSNTNETTLMRLLPLVNEASELYPPAERLADDWGDIAEGWKDLGVDINHITVRRLAECVTQGASKLTELKLRVTPIQWIAHFVNLVGECWEARDGVELHVLDGILPNQSEKLCSPADIKRDEGLSAVLKDIGETLGLDFRAQLLHRGIFEVEDVESLTHLRSAVQKALPIELSENDVLNEICDHVSGFLQDGDKINDDNRSLLLGSIRLFQYLWESKAEGGAAVARKLPLMTTDGKVYYWTNERMLMVPVSHWHQDAQEFSGAYPPQRVLAEEYCACSSDDSSSIVIDALVAWGIAIADPLHVDNPADLKERRLAAMAFETDDTEGISVTGETFSQIALLHPTIFNRVQENESAASSLLGLVLKYVAPRDPGWQTLREVKGKLAKNEVGLMLRESLWLADLTHRAWVPFPGEDGKTARVAADASSLKTLLNPVWLEKNDAAIRLLSEHFGFDALDLRLLGAAPDDLKRQSLRDGLARIVEAAGSDTNVYDAITDELLSREKRKRDVNRFRDLGLAVQNAIQESLESRGLHIKVIDKGFDFAVGTKEPETIEEMATWLEVGAELLEIKATTTGMPRMTSTQAEMAASESHRYSLCVVNLQGVSEERLDEPWKARDVDPLAKLVKNIGAAIKATCYLVEQARTQKVGIRNQRALRYEVPTSIWKPGMSIDSWVDVTFSDRAKDSSSRDENGQE